MAKCNQLTSLNL